MKIEEILKLIPAADGGGSGDDEVKTHISYVRDNIKSHLHHGIAIPQELADVTELSREGASKLMFHAFDRGDDEYR